MDSSTAILIPSYNSNSKLDTLVKEIRSITNSTILVIDDGSVDPIALSQDNIHLVRNRRNMGKGYSLRRGFSFFEDRGYSHVVTMDSDLQHSPSELGKFLDADLKIDLVLGYRERAPSMPSHRKFSNFITSFIISKITGVKILDSQCGFRRYSLNILKNIKFIEDGFQFESEVLIKTINRDIDIEQIKVSTIYDKNNKSYIKHLSDTLKFVRLILRSLFKR